MSENLTRFENLVHQICERPCLYVSQYDIESVAAYLDGFAAASGPQVQKIWGDYQRWVEAQYGVFDSAWHWNHILLYGNGNQRAAIQAIHRLFKDLIEFGTLPEPPEEWVYEKVRAVRGKGLFSPPNEHPFEKEYPMGDPPP